MVPARRASQTRRRRAASVLTLIAAVGPGVARGADVPTAASASVARSTEKGPLIPRSRVVLRTLHGGTEQDYLLYVPAGAGAGAPVFVTVHGISRNFVEHATLFAPYAERYGVVLVAPCFNVGTHDDYQRLWHQGGGRRADFSLDSILTEVESLTGARTRTFRLFGFSGGAQFAHRYAMIHPKRVAAAVVAAAGWYTFPDSTVSYPYGIGRSDELRRARFEPREFLRVPMKVLVGGADTSSYHMRKNEFVDRQQGKTRRERAHRWAGAMQRAARALGEEPLVSCEQVPGIEHSFKQFMEEGQLGDRVFRALYGRPPARTAQRDTLATNGRVARSR